ncbi:LemA family protein [Ginsengibacter hankyongi]|uniref:LemA family protein n=1 Tax=Ginsengibacter hankyongi TaxID=2607284 RepID=A0A5J5ILU9_9BACT|nr:LemA family protein [Ginsengibacter hankyongi]KAA9042055.1 LemA family protein [Ginsengibacter hankyongi]
MKGKSRSCFITLIVIFLIVTVLTFLLRLNTLNNFEINQKIVDSEWAKLYKGVNERNDLFKKIIAQKNKENEIFDSLRVVLEKVYKNYALYKKGCTLDFVEGEHILNNEYLKSLKAFSLDSSLLNKEGWGTLKELKVSDNEMNNVIADYNNSVLENNKYISTFPNFILAKRNGFSKKKFFTIKYGIKNEDPIEKSKKLPEWAKNKDTL